MASIYKIAAIAFLVTITGAHLSQAYDFTVKNCTDKWILANLHGQSEFCGSVEYHLAPGASETHEIPGKHSGMVGTGCCAGSIHVYHTWNPSTRRFEWDQNLDINFVLTDPRCASHTIYIQHKTDSNGQPLKDMWAGIETKGFNPSC